MSLVRIFSGEEFCDGIRGLIRSIFLSSTIKVDDFTARLFRIYMQVLEEGLAQVPWQETPVVSSCAPSQCGGIAWSLSASLLAAVGFELSRSQANCSPRYNVSVTACELRTLPCLTVMPFG